MSFTEREESDAWREKYEALRPRRDALAAEFKQAYAAIPKIVDVLMRMRALKTEINKLHNERPINETLYLHSARTGSRDRREQHSTRWCW